jgi:hypothetical protein
MTKQSDIINNIKFNQSPNKVIFKLGKDNIYEIYKSIIGKKDHKIIKKEINNYFTNNEETFIEFLNKEKEKSNKDIYKLFFKEYNNYYEKFIKKIKNILDNINKHSLTLNNLNHGDFLKKYKIKIDNIDKLLTNPTNNNNTGKYTKVLPYTNILLVYLLYLLLIIDYLTYFYK